MKCSKCLILASLLAHKSFRFECQHSNVNIQLVLFLSKLVCDRHAVKWIMTRWANHHISEMAHWLLRLLLQILTSNTPHWVIIIYFVLPSGGLIIWGREDEPRGGVFLVVSSMTTMQADVYYFSEWRLIGA